MRNIPKFEKTTLTQKKIIKGLIIVLSGGVIVLLLINLFITRQNIWLSLAHLNRKTLFLSFILILFSVFISTLRLGLMVKILKEQISLLEAIKIYYISTFAGGITPFFSGAVPVQIYLLHQNIRNKIPLGKATIITTFLPLLKTLVLVIFAPIVFFYFRNTLSKYSMFSNLLMLIATLSSLLLIAAFILCINYPEKLIKIILQIQQFPFLNHFFKRKNVSSRMEKLLSEIHAFNHISYLFKKNWLKLLILLFYTIIFLGIYFSIPLLLLWGFDLKLDPLPILTIEIIFYFLLPFIPTPGGIGAAELGFASLFSWFVPPDILVPFIGTWRFITFYFNLFVGAIVLLVEITQSDKKR